MSRSLVTTLIRRLLLVGGLLTLMNIVFVTAYYSSDPEGLRREKVSHQIDRLAETLRAGPDGSLAFEPSSRLMQTFMRYPDAYAFRIEDGAGHVLGEANAMLVPAERWSVPNGPDAWWSDVEVNGRSVLVGSRRVRVGGEAVRIAFAAAGDPSNLLLFVYFDELFVHVIVSLLPFAICLMIVNAVTVRHSLRSLVHAADAARKAGPGHGIAALPTRGLPTEVLILVEAINDPLRRLGEALEAERAFTAEAAHALRTPLAVLSARIEKLPKGGELDAVHSDIAALRRLVNQLLSAAEADTLVVDPARQCDLSIVAEGVVAAMAPLAIRDGRILAFEARPGTIVRGDADAIAHALRNLVENALRFSPENTEVLVRVSGPGQVAVLDRGPGVPDEQKPLVMKRFWRARPSDLGGTGLGLAIVQRIAEAHGTTLGIADREGGGTVFSLAFSPHRGGRAS
ncbi:MAG: HAMP domain-containing histidine kinase [Methylobacterium sp.]|nr:HAMP domain-containing histidine kinase [Methylobacterium sp.]MCA3659253.1 HAMP domain-containing histidine kinase [Methylobacterium sp.]MCA3662144.1 HAMP domain-containing histidine kinase [Methylobacterium sp.]MCA3663361.1 HAMP domain-containing histidine kinase [Methylobacterium sp.]MCA3670106.1 HAMP domain-containing histidine kinase [Methylobacterium sp.]